MSEQFFFFFPAVLSTGGKEKKSQHSTQWAYWGSCAHPIILTHFSFTQKTSVHSSGCRTSRARCVVLIVTCSWSRRRTSRHSGWRTCWALSPAPSPSCSCLLRPQPQRPPSPHHRMPPCSRPHCQSSSPPVGHRQRPPAESAEFPAPCASFAAHARLTAGRFPVVHKIHSDEREHYFTNFVNLLEAGIKYVWPACEHTMTINLPCLSNFQLLCNICTCELFFDLPTRPLA